MFRDNRKRPPINCYPLPTLNTLKTLLIPSSIRVVTFLIAAFQINGAIAYCSEPYVFSTPPDAPSSYEKPDVPYCLQEYSYSREHSCESYEIDTYFDEVNDYIQKLNDYISEANNFASEAVQFANDVSDYARCEADDVKNQHE